MFISQLELLFDAEKLCAFGQVIFFAVTHIYSVEDDTNLLVYSLVSYNIK